MTRIINRWLVVLAGVTGLLFLAPATAQAFIVANHTEPVRRTS